MQSHTRGAISMGLRGNYHRSRKNKLNKKSSTKAELVGDINYVPYKIWYIWFMHHHVYLNKPKKFFQENQSATRMDMNRRNFFTFNFRHISTNFVFIKDRVEK